MARKIETYSVGSAFQVALAQNLPASTRDIRQSVPSLGQEDHLKEGAAAPGPSLENPTDRGAWRAAVRRVAESNTTEVT